MGNDDWVWDGASEVRHPLQVIPDGHLWSRRDPTRRLSACTIMQGERDRDGSRLAHLCASGMTERLGMAGMTTVEDSKRKRAQLTPGPFDILILSDERTEFAPDESGQIRKRGSRGNVLTIHHHQPYLPHAEHLN